MPPRLLLIIEMAELLAGAVLHEEGAPVSSIDQGDGKRRLVRSSLLGRRIDKCSSTAFGNHV
jgi:hypothetical protein